MRILTVGLLCSLLLLTLSCSKEEASKAPPPPDDETKKKVEESDLKLNVYQMALAIDRGAATPVDLRMMLFPEETEEQAKAAVMSSIEFNNELAEIIAKAKAIEAEVLEGKGKKKKKPEEGKE